MNSWATPTTVDLSKQRAVIIASMANDFVVSRLIAGAKNTFLDARIFEGQQSLVRVPGALEIPVALKKMAPHFDLFVVLGAVIKGQTDHYEHVSKMAFEGVSQVMLENTLALGNGIMTVHSIELALARADGPSGNLGVEAAKAALSLKQLFLSYDKTRL